MALAPAPARLRSLKLCHSVRFHAHDVWLVRRDGSLPASAGVSPRWMWSLMPSWRAMSGRSSSGPEPSEYGACGLMPSSVTPMARMSWIRSSRSSGPLRCQSSLFQSITSQ